MNHPFGPEELREVGSLYSLGILPPEQMRLLEEHLRQGCPSCMEEIDSFLSVADELAHLAPQIDPSPGLRAKLLDLAGRDLASREAAAAAVAAAPAAPMAIAQDSAANAPAASDEQGIQVWKNWDSAAPAPPLFLLRSNDSDWEATKVPGVAVRRLFFDAERQSVTMLVRMEAGARYPSHRHGGVEECYVLEGDLHVGDTIMKKGDYQRVETDQVHGVQSTEKGCTLLILSSLHDEILA
jgi:anti-sigma factor ChrR (cupin superfamily)